MPEDDVSLQQLLASIDRRLALLTGSHERDLRRALAEDLLRTDKRQAMFAAIDGETGASDMAKKAGVSERAAQLFVKELLEMGIVRKSRASTARGIIVERDEDAIVQWYFRREGAAS